MWILLAADNVGTREALRGALEANGFRVVAKSSNDALQLLDSDGWLDALVAYYDSTRPQPGLALRILLTARRLRPVPRRVLVASNPLVLRNLARDAPYVADIFATDTALVEDPRGALAVRRHPGANQSGSGPTFMP